MDQASEIKADYHTTLKGKVKITSLLLVCAAQNHLGRLRKGKFLSGLCLKRSVSLLVEKKKKLISSRYENILCNPSIKHNPCVYNEIVKQLALTS